MSESPELLKSESNEPVLSQSKEHNQWLSQGIDSPASGSLVFSYR